MSQPGSQNFLGEIGRGLSAEQFREANIQDRIVLLLVLVHCNFLPIHSRNCCFARCNKFLAPSSLIPKAAAMAARD